MRCLFTEHILAGTAIASLGPAISIGDGKAVSITLSNLHPSRAGTSKLSLPSPILSITLRLSSWDRSQMVNASTWQSELCQPGPKRRQLCHSISLTPCALISTPGADAEVQTSRPVFDRVSTGYASLLLAGCRYQLSRSDSHWSEKEAHFVADSLLPPTAASLLKAIEA